MADAKQNPSDVFLAYTGPLGLAPETVSARWEGVRAYEAKATVASIEALIDIAFKKDATIDAAEPLWACLKEVDTNFTTINAGRALELLAAATLDHIFTTTRRLDTLAATGVVTASFGNRKPKNLPVDLVSRALAEIDNIATIARDRSGFVAAIAKLNAFSANVPEEIEQLKADPGNGTLAAEAIGKAITNLNSAILKTNNQIRTTLGTVGKHLDVLAEEADVFWYAFGGRSLDLDLPFTKLGGFGTAFTAAKEIADRTASPLRHAVVKSLVAHCGAQGKRGTVAAAVDAVNLKHVEDYASGTFSATTTPLHRALARRRDFDGADNWQAGWSKSTGIPEDFGVDPTQLGHAFYLERIFLDSAQE